jgi:hypothetical protein
MVEAIEKGLKGVERVLELMVRVAKLVSAAILMYNSCRGCRGKAFGRVTFDLCDKFCLQMLRPIQIEFMTMRM